MIEEVGYLGSNDSRFEALAALILASWPKIRGSGNLVHTPYLPRDLYTRRVGFPRRPLHHMYH